jgi:hypothetical protein
MAYTANLPEWLRRILLGILFLGASFFLFAGFGMWLGNPGGYHESLIVQPTPVTSIFLALLLARGIAWMLRQPEAGLRKSERDLSHST